MMRFTVLTLFPELLRGALRESILGRAEAAGQVSFALHDIREHAEGKHRICDDSPYGGGAGMVMKPEPLVAAIEAARASRPSPATERVVLMGPAGAVFTQEKARSLAGLEHLVLVCGRYEGIDERVQAYADEELSIGDFVLSGGEPAALVVIDAVTRLLPGVLGNAISTQNESFEDGCLEYPQYTRPPVFREQAVPEALLSGDHARIARFRRRESLLRTRARRPDLFDGLELDPDDRELLETWDEKQIGEKT